MSAIVSIIIPVYNRPKLVAECLNSVLAQTNPNWECIVVDDGSTDNTWEVLEKYAKKDKRIRIFKRDREPKGAPTCRNMGADKATGEYFIFFDSDDLFFPWSIDIISKALLKCGNVELAAYQQICQQNKTNKAWYRCVESKPEGYIYNYISFKRALSTSALIWHKSTFFKTDKWDETLKSWQDPPLILNAFFLNINFRWVSSFPLALIRMGQDGNQITDKANFSQFVRSFNTIYQNLSIENKLVFKRSIRKLLWRYSIYYHNYSKLNTSVQYLFDNELLSNSDKRNILLYYKLYRLTKHIFLLRSIVYKLQFMFYKKLPSKEFVYINALEVLQENVNFKSLSTIEQNKLLSFFFLKHSLFNA